MDLKVLRVGFKYFDVYLENRHIGNINFNETTEQNVIFLFTHELAEFFQLSLSDFWDEWRIIKEPTVKCVKQEIIKNLKKEIAALSLKEVRLYKSIEQFM